MDEKLLDLTLILGAIFCAYRAMIARRILTSTLWLAVVSALVATMLYQLGAYQVAVIELSVGAGLVTVLLVYAISVTGDDAIDTSSVIPKPLAVALVVIAGTLLFRMVLPLLGKTTFPIDTTLETILWQQRVLDVWVQIVLIFGGVMGLLGLLAEGKSKPRSGLQSLTEVRGKSLIGTQDIPPVRFDGEKKTEPVLSELENPFGGRPRPKPTPNGEHPESVAGNDRRVA